MAIQKDMKGSTENPKNAWLILEDSSVFKGFSIGYPKNTVGELVFTTGMIGYTESLTDPSYKGQILCFTYPLIGNYGVPSYSMIDRYGFPMFFESESIKVQGVVIHELCLNPSHWTSTMSFNDWLYMEGIPGISGIDTRYLTKKLRVEGVMMGAMVFDDPENGFKLLKNSKSYESINFVEEVSVKKPIIYGRGKNIVLIDCGVKLNIIRQLILNGFRVVRVPYSYSIDEILSYNPHGIVISNGPGNPKRCEVTIKTIRRIIDETDLPILGICLGNQIIALALNADTFKLKYGHRGQNKPCIDVETGKCYITSQNHGYAVNEKTLENTELKTWFRNVDDGTVEGLKHISKPILSVQYHPEASPGPYDTSWIFSKFLNYIKEV
ncbi:MAG: glutamine-hydrolyzing carbamoyl-phosphate synthase small subunit [Candidatus Methanomethylicia archaeon]